MCVCSRAKTVDPNYSSYTSYNTSSYKSAARATTVSPSSAYTGYYGRSNVARAEDYRPRTTWYRPSRYSESVFISESDIVEWICKFTAIYFMLLQVYHDFNNILIFKIQKFIPIIQNKIFLIPILRK